MGGLERFVRRGELRLVVKMTAAGTLAWCLCTVAGQARPLFAVLVPLVAMGDDPFGALNVSLTRVVGVFAGVALGLGLLKLSASSTAIVALTLACGLLLGLPLRLGAGRPNIERSRSAPSSWSTSAAAIPSRWPPLSTLSPCDCLYPGQVASC
jgi:hypothetical protein